MDELVELCQGKHGRGVVGVEARQGQVPRGGADADKRSVTEKAHTDTKSSVLRTSTCPFCVRNYQSVCGHES